MISKDYVYWKGAIPPHVCDQILKFGENQRLNKAKIGAGPQQQVVSKVRDSSISFVKAPWILDWILSPVYQANKDIFSYELTGHEYIQFTKYNVGQHYNWHLELTKENVGDSICRKLSIIIPLNDPSEYEGGEIEFRSMRLSPDDPAEDSIISKPEFKERGTLLVFPSIIFHRVKPITKGTRYSLVCWWGGPPFR